jgi:hypothetical protein
VVEPAAFGSGRDPFTRWSQKVSGWNPKRTGRPRTRVHAPGVSLIPASAASVATGSRVEDTSGAVGWRRFRECSSVWRPSRWSRESAAARLVRLPLGAARHRVHPAEDSVRGSQGPHASVESSVLTSSMRGSMRSSDKGCPSATRSGSILGGDNRRLRARSGNSVSPRYP